MHPKQNALNWSLLLPIILSYFVVGLAGITGAVSNYVQADFGLSDASSGLLASAVYVWFFVFAIPTGMVMNRFGYRKTVIMSLIISCVALLIPMLYYSHVSMIIALCVLGMANAMLQISINLLVSEVTPKKKLSSVLTLGQFVGQIPSMLVPFMALLAIQWFGNWRLIYPLFLLISIVIVYRLTQIKIEEQNDHDPADWHAYFLLLKNKAVLLCFLAIICQVGIDVGVAVTSPKILIERAHVAVDNATFITSVYAVVRLVGCLVGAYFLSKFSNQKIYVLSVMALLMGGVGLLFLHEQIAIYVCVVLLGLGMSNLFAIIFSQALALKPRKKGEISGLMIMGLVGGAVFPPIMGLASRLVGGHQFGAVMVMLVCGVFMLYVGRVIQDDT